MYPEESSAFVVAHEPIKLAVSSFIGVLNVNVQFVQCALGQWSYHKLCRFVNFLFHFIGFVEYECAKRVNFNMNKIIIKKKKKKN